MTTPAHPIPPWLRKAEPVLLERMSQPLFDSVYEASQRVRAESFRTSRGRRFLFYNVVSPIIVAIGVLGGIALIDSNYFVATMLLYGVPISQIILVLKRGARSSHENLLSPQVLKDLWLAGCRGSELVAVTPMRIALNAPRVSWIAALIASAATWWICVVLDLPNREAIMVGAVVLLCSREVVWWGMGVAAPMFLVHFARQQFMGAVSLFQMVMWFAIVMAVAVTILIINQMAVLIFVGAVMQAGFTLLTAVLCYLVGVTVILMAVRWPAAKFIRQIQQGWLDHIDEVFDSYVRKGLLKDPDAEREIPDVEDDGHDDGDGGVFDGDGVREAGQH